MAVSEATRRQALDASAAQGADIDLTYEEARVLMSDPSDEIAELATELAEERHLHQQTLAERDRLRAMLGSWAAAAPRCFWCNAPHGAAHGPRCELAAVLHPDPEQMP